MTERVLDQIGIVSVGFCDFALVVKTDGEKLVLDRESINDDWGDLFREDSGLISPAFKEAHQLFCEKRWQMFGYQQELISGFLGGLQVLAHETGVDLEPVEKV